MKRRLEQKYVATLGGMLQLKETDVEGRNLIIR
jgi:hypothetical protein